MNIEVGEKYCVTVIKIIKHGIIVQMGNCSDTEFIHISKLSHRFVSDISKLVSIGDKLEAVCIQGNDRCELSLQHLHLESNNPSEKSVVHSNESESNATFEDMLAAAENSLREKQLAVNNRLQRKRKFKQIKR